MRTYELMVIHRPELAEEDVKSEMEQLSNSLQGLGAEVAETDSWGKRRFAYEIDHVKEGYYSVVTFEADTPAVETIDRALSLADTVIRHKIVRPEGQTAAAGAVDAVDEG